MARRAPAQPPPFELLQLIDARLLPAADEISSTHDDLPPCKGRSNPLPKSEPQASQAALGEDHASHD